MDLLSKLKAIYFHYKKNLRIYLKQPVATHYNTWSLKFPILSFTKSDANLRKKHNELVKEIEIISRDLRKNPDNMELSDKLLNKLIELNKIIKLSNDYLNNKKH